MATNLEAANQILLQKRAEARQARIDAGLPVDIAQERATAVSPLPSLSDIGFHSDRVTAVYRQSLENQQQPDPEPSPWWTTWQPPEPSVDQQPEPRETAVFCMTHKISVYAATAVAFLVHDHADVGRIFHLLKYIDDKRGAVGWLPLADIYNVADDMGISRRRLRQIMSEGDGIAWDRYADKTDKRRTNVRLFSPGGVCQKLGVDYSRCRVSLPLGAFFAGELREQRLTAVKMTAVHFYGCVHHLTGETGVISRDTLKLLTGLSDETQRHYEWLLQIKPQRNYRHTHEHPEHEPAWVFGGVRNLNQFVYHDYSTAARQRSPHGEMWLVIALPNSYSPPFETVSKGRKRSDLAYHGRGNATVRRIFHKPGKRVDKLAGQLLDHDALVQDAYVGGNTALWENMACTTI